MYVLSNEKEVLAAANVSSEKILDPISIWLIITQTTLFSMTLTSGLIGGLFAIPRIKKPDWLNFGLAVVGLILTHAANHMTNDDFDSESGLDNNDECARALYAPHPMRNRLVTKRGLLIAILSVNLMDAGFWFILTLRVGWPVLVFAALGLFINIFYVAPSTQLKHHGLGESGGFHVW
jgi:1,4-dihydroxy-2-naphthoate octaprenyltransferase